MARMKKCKLGKQRIRLNHRPNHARNGKGSGADGWTAGAHLPLLQALDALRVELLDGDDDSGGALGRVEGALVDPALVHPAEAAFPEHHLRLEPPGHCPQLCQRELPKPGHLENAPRPRRARRPWTPVLFSPAAARILRPCRRPCTYAGTPEQSENAINSNHRTNLNKLIELKQRLTFRCCILSWARRFRGGVREAEVPHAEFWDSIRSRVPFGRLA